MNGFDALRALGYTVETYEPEDGEVVIAVRGHGVAVSFHASELDAHLQGLLDPEAHAARIEQQTPREPITE